MTVPRLPPGQIPTSEQFNQLVRLALQNIVGGDGIRVERTGNQIIINAAGRDRGIWTGITDEQLSGIPNVSEVSGTLASPVALSGGNWNDILSITAPGTGDTCLCWAHFESDYSPMLGRVIEGSTVRGNDGSATATGNIFCRVAAGATIKLQCYDDGGGKNIQAGLTYLSCVLIA